ncbi:MAG: hypothetical protein IH991_15545 [Planctomycetes bacterium]|nr:hypothetical protein [Planctomycetota bacterium]
MASIELDPVSKRYRIRFRFNGQPFKRSIRTKDRKEARSIRGRVKETLTLIERGRLVVPDDVDPAAFSGCWPQRAVLLQTEPMLGLDFDSEQRNVVRL